MFIFLSFFKKVKVKELWLNNLDSYGILDDSVLVQEHSNKGIESNDWR